jgi:hypothetical protein
MRNRASVINNNNTKAETVCALRAADDPSWSIVMSPLIRTLLLVALVAVLPARAATVGVISADSTANLSLAPFTTTVDVPGIGNPGLGFRHVLEFTLNAPETVTLEAETVNVQALTMLLPAGLLFAFQDPDSRIASGFLGAGTYVAELTGEVLGTSAGTYSFRAFVAAIPEPHTWMLLLAGLFAFGAVVVRRR